MKNKIIPGLNALRAIAAIIVIYFHTQYIGNLNGIKLIKLPYIDGHLSVILFFVLSGYLISSLLLIEKKTYSQINIKYFYIRRILRIWPLYFLILLLSILILQYKPSTLSFILNLLILPNIAMSLNEGWSASPQIWSIGIEEQFYLIWPLIILFSKKNLLKIIISLILILTFLPHILLYFFNQLHLNNHGIISFINESSFNYKFSCLIIGSLFAYLSVNNSKILFFIKRLSIIFIITPFILWFSNINFSFFTDEIFAIFFGFLIIGISHKSFYLFNNKIVSYLGEISYGLYMYHWIILVIISNLLISNNSTNTIINTVILYLGSISCTILISSLSYTFFEKFFLSFKNKFSIN